MAPIEPSLEARNNPLGEELWKRSAELAGLTETWGLP
jgi:hypothetical protein